MTEHNPALMIAPNGKMGAVINVGNPILAWRTSDDDVDGPSVRIARRIAAALGVKLDLRVVEHARESFDMLLDGRADIGFLAIDPHRAEQLAFSDPYLTIEGGYLVPQASSLREVRDVDYPFIKIAASRGSAYSLHLQRTITSATLVETASFGESLSLLKGARVDAVAGIKEAFLQGTEDDTWRVLDGSFMEIKQAVCVAKSKSDAIDFLNQQLVGDQ